MNKSKRPTARTVSQMKNHKLVWKTKKQNIRYNVIDFSISL